MLRTLYLGLLPSLLFLGALHAQSNGDKTLHFAGGALAGAVGGVVASEISDKNTFWTITGSVGASLLAGAIKEAIDAGEEDNSWDNGDLVVTGLGGLTAGVTISIFTGNSKKKKAKPMAYRELPAFENNSDPFKDLHANQVITD